MPSQWSVHNKAEKVTDSAHNTQSRDDIQSQKAGHLFSQSKKKKKDQDKFPVMIFLKKASYWYLHVQGYHLLTNT